VGALCRVDFSLLFGLLKGSDTGACHLSHLRVKVLLKAVLTSVSRSAKGTSKDMLPFRSEQCSHMHACRHV